jgi:hypothetical protein
MAGESIFPDNLDPTILDGDTGVKTIANRFTVDEARPADAGRIYVRVGGLPATALWQLWNEDTATKLAELDMNAELVSPTGGQFSDWVELASPVDLEPGVSYIVARHLAGSPGYEFSDGVPAVFPVGTPPLESTTGLFQNGGGPNTMPTGEYSAYFFADVRLADPGGANEGSSALGIGLSLAATGSTQHEGDAAGGISLALAAQGSSVHEGTASGGIDLTLTASGSATHGGTAAAGIGLSVAATGARPAQGTAAFVLNLGLTASAFSERSTPTLTATTTAPTLTATATRPTLTATI